MGPHSLIVHGEEQVEPFHSGTLAGIGSFQCQTCDYVVSLAAEDTLPECPGCGGQEFVRASLFAAPGFAGEQPHEAEDDRPEWLAQARTEPEQGLSDDEHGHDRGLERLERVTKERNSIHHCVTDALCCRLVELLVVASKHCPVERTWIEACQVTLTVI